ncbi:MAG: hypothetical protein U9M95_04990 [Candidatus Altiarchaeota archaeon]|nr:hypothetical protein [Candidatus Altiarchaeota archaeon]
MKTAIVLTTIHIPYLLEEYAKNFEKHNPGDVEFIMIGDLKTPKESETIISNIQDKGFEAEYFDVLKQEKWLQCFPELKQMIPYNSDNRRNIGYLIAVEQGAEIIVSIDDDNYVRDGDYLAGHQIVGTTQTLKTVKSSNQWFNPCSMLETDPKRIIYPRGFPYSKRWMDDASFSNSTGRVVINAGLWLGCPDVDAVTNLNEPVKTVAMNSEQIMLASETFSPINTQNTAFHREVLPCYYYIVMGARINGYDLDRYGDIWSGFFAKKVIDQVGDKVTFGYPLTDHRRNIHDLFKDLQNELGGMILTDKLVPIIESIKLREKTYSNAYLELAEQLKEEINCSREFNDGEKDYFHQVTNNMRVWVDVCDKIMN